MNTIKLTQSIRKYESLIASQPRYSTGTADLSNLNDLDLMSYLDYLIKLYNDF